MHRQGLSRQHRAKGGLKTEKLNPAPVCRPETAGLTESPASNRHVIHRKRRVRASVKPLNFNKKRRLPIKQPESREEIEFCSNAILQNLSKTYHFAMIGNFYMCENGFFARHSAPLWPIWHDLRCAHHAPGCREALACQKRADVIRSAGVTLPGVRAKGADRHRPPDRLPTPVSRRSHRRAAQKASVPSSWLP